MQLDPWENYILSVFYELCSDRPQHFGGPGAIPMRAFVDYQELWNDELSTDEVEVLRAIDRAYLRAAAELNKD